MSDKTTCECRKGGWNPLCPNHGRETIKPPVDETLDARRSWQAYFNAGLPWTGEFEEAVMRGEVDVS